MLPKVCSMLALACCFLPIIGDAQVAAVKVTVHVPGISGADRGVFITGNFNGWRPGDSLYRMTRKSGGIFTITLPLFRNQAYEYKYTLGDWEHVEIAATGTNISNRRFTASKHGRIKDTVARWNEPKTAEKKPLSPQMQKIIAMKDSLLASLKPEAGNLLGMLKEHIMLLLQDNPDKEAHLRISRQAIAKVEGIHAQVSEFIWNIFASFTPQQKQKIRTSLSEATSRDDLINNVFKAIGDALETNAPVK